MFQVRGATDSPPSSPEGPLRPPLIYNTPYRPRAPPLSPTRPLPSDGPLGPPLNWKFPTDTPLPPPTRTSPSPPPPPPISINEEMAEKGCKYCSHVAVCATHASKGLEIGSETWEDDLEFIINDEREMFMGRSVLAVKLEVNEQHLKELQEARKFKKLGLPKESANPFCCDSLQVNWENSRMEGSNPQFFLLLEELVKTSTIPAKIRTNFYSTNANLHKVKRVYRVNVRGRRGQSTWLFFKYHHERPSAADGGPSEFGCIVYVDRAIPFNPDDRYVTWDCEGSHPGRQYQIGIYNKTWVKVNGLDRQTYGDEEVDRLMLEPVRRRRIFGITTIEGHTKALTQEQEAAEAMIEMR
ncbi:hypothetical protein BDZ45DRAFT_743870 [Acephala macrosclerotiorum]|nr:hypothetical protein BDZ45DRAFT_743870 [Acephala macrosclerotiorum]